MSMPLTIDAIYAWVAIESNGAEGVCATTVGGLVMPLIGADIDRIKSLRPFAEQTYALTGRPVHLLRFSRREDLEIIE